VGAGRGALRLSQQEQSEEQEQQQGVSVLLLHAFAGLGQKLPAAHGLLAGAQRRRRFDRSPATAARLGERNGRISNSPA